MAKLNRRRLLAWAAGTTLSTSPLLAAIAANKSEFIATKITPERNRTRIVIESGDKLRYRYFALHEPERLVIDVENMAKNAVLEALPRQVQAQDNLIKNIRLGQKDTTTVRVVLDLKQAADAQITAIAPSGKLKHRLQIDVLPKGSGSKNVAAPANRANAKDDPLMDLLNERQNNTQKNAQNTVAKPNNRPMIVIDAGHGGKDPGATGQSGLMEKTITLATALELKNILEAKGYVVQMTRSTDVFIPLRERRQRAHKNNADLFISIHANASDVATLRGADVFVWGQSNSERARKLAKAENDADLVDGIPSVGNKNVDAILTDMMQAQTTADSTRVGNLMLRHMGKSIKLHKSTVETADFVVLRSIGIPSVLVEMAFLSNPEDEKLLKTTAFRRKVAQGIGDAVQQYFAGNSR